ncbi:MAG: DUF5724 domain-containing protein [Planctomycetota bacterium]|jgi:hypothetical protein
MLDRKKAEKELEQVRVKEWKKVQIKRIGSLKRRTRKTARKLTEAFGGRTVLQEILSQLNSSDVPETAWSFHESSLPEAAEELDAMCQDERLSIFEALFPSIAVHVEYAWQMQKKMPYMHGFINRSFRAPNMPEASRMARVHWLKDLVCMTQGYDKDVCWFAQWAPYLAHWLAGENLGVLFAAAIDGGGREGEDVYETLVASARGDHEVGAMGRHVTRGLMTCSRQDGWEFVEKLLLAAQRQEGLRQVILESVDMSHPEAFRRMLKLILNENLVRFSSVVRAADVWFSLQWDSASAGVLRNLIEKAVLYLEDVDARREALVGESVESVYMALWATAFEDAFTAIPAAGRLLRHADAEHRFTGIWMLNQLGLYRAIEVGLRSLDDQDLRVAAVVVSMVSDGDYSEATKDNVFGRLERVYERFPEKRKKQESLLWPWLELKVARADVADAMGRNLKSLSVDRILPYVRAMSSESRGSFVRKLAKRKIWTGNARRLLVELIGDRSPYVRETVLENMGKLKVRGQEAQELEALMRRKTGDIRRGVLGVLLGQRDGAVLASADRLLEGPHPLQRQAGLELLKRMVEKKRSVGACRKRAQQYEREAVKLSEGEKPILDALVGDRRKVATLKNALGLCDLSKRTKIEGLKKHEIEMVTPAVKVCINSLDDLIHKHREHPVPAQYGGGQALLGNAGVVKPESGVSLEEDLPRLPLAEVWQDWCAGRGNEMRDEDGLELVRLLVQTHLSSPYRAKGWWKKGVKALFGGSYVEKARYSDHFHSLGLWLVKLEPHGREVVFLLDAAEMSLGLIGPGHGAKYLYDYSSPYLVCLNAAISHRECFSERWSDEHVRWLWRLLKWYDEPSVRVDYGSIAEELGIELKQAKSGRHRHRPDFGLLAEAYSLGEANDADVYDHLLGRRGEASGQLWYGHSFDLLEMVTRHRVPKKVKMTDELWEIVRRCRERVLEVELARGDTPTEATGPALAIKYVEGMEHFVNFAKSLGKGTLARGWRRDSQSKEAVFSHLIRVSFPGSDETAEDFAVKVKEAGLGEKRLLELAVFAPQWAKMIEGMLKWKGLAEAVWWIHAHTKDRQWEVPEEIRESWIAEVTERTPLGGDDLLEGGVDVEWFGRVYKHLKKSRWERLYKCAKFASGGGGHRRAQLYAEAMLGLVKKTELVERITEKRNQDYVRALGLLPLSRGKARQKDLLGRYEVLQEFVRASRQFGSQRQASEKRAAAIGQENLARTAGYPDPIRLQWAMEAKAVADLADGPIEVKIDDKTSASLSIDEFGQVQFGCVKDGKRLKSVPARAKALAEIKALRKRKTELKRQVSRIRANLERMMCRGEAFSGSEVGELMRHPLIGPMLSRLVFVGDGIVGYAREGGRVLEDFSGKLEPVKKTEQLRIAHPHDLLDTGRWHQWQHECFEAERVQPFKQVFRELYVLTDSERKEKEVSRRYAGHQVNPRQALALLGSRGWVFKPEEGVRRTFHDKGISAWLELQEAFYTPAEVEGVTLEGVRFSKQGEWKPIRLEEVPALVFSEVMRDVDLVVSVAHRGGVDPEASASTIEMRKSLLRETLAVLSVENVRMKDNHTLVDGALGSYSVHMGSAVTHIMPGGALFIVAVHAQHRGRLFLPFADDDPKTAEVLSKILLLARDSEIKDPNILDQIRLLSSR